MGHQDRREAAQPQYPDCFCAGQFKKTITSIQGPLGPAPPEAWHSPEPKEGVALGPIFGPRTFKSRPYSHTCPTLHHI